MDESRLRALVGMTPLEHRFWAKVDIVDDDTSCWEWAAFRHPDGYGQFQYDGRSVNAQRIALMLTTGTIPGVACHHCDNPPCVRPSHLYDGDSLSNSADRVSRGRAKGKIDQRGEANDSAVLTEALVIEARHRVLAGERTTALAREYGVKYPTLSYAVTGKTWAHLDSVAQPVGGRRGGGKIALDQHETIRAAYASGTSGRALAEQYGVTPSLISKIVHRTSS